MLTVSQIKEELAINESRLYSACLAGNLTEIVVLRQQRDNLKDMLIEVLSEQYAKVG